MKKFFNGKLKPQKLRTILLLIMILAILISSISITSIILINYKSKLQNVYIASITDSLSAIKAKVNTYINSKIVTPSKILLNNDEFIDILNENREQTEHNKLVLTYLLNKALPISEIDINEKDFYLLTINKKGEVFNLSEPFNTEDEDLIAFINSLESIGKTQYSDVWLPPMNYCFSSKEEENFVIPHIQNIITLTPYRYQGRIIQALKETSLYEIYKDSTILNTGTVFIIDEGGNIISSSNRNDKPLKWTFYNEKLSSLENGSYIDKQRDKIIIVLSDEENSWRYIAELTLSTIYQQINKELIKYIFIVLVIIIISLLLVTTLTRHTTYSLETLKANMLSTIETKNFNTSIEERGPKDIRDLTSSYNHLINEIDYLINKEIEISRQKKVAEFDALVTQINPHFLSNTLESIVWKAYMNNSPEIADMAHMLGQLFNMALNKGESMVSLHKELLYVQTYIALQNHRFGNKLKLKILDNTGEDLETIIIPKLILQPIIENSIKHGYKSYMEQFNITISLETEGKELKMQIIDSGLGMEEEKCVKVNEKLKNTNISYDDKIAKKNFNKGEGIGMINVHQRIQLYYGNNYGLTIIESDKNGTIILMRLPLF